MSRISRFLRRIRLPRLGLYPTLALISAGAVLVILASVDLWSWFIIGDHIWSVSEVESSSRVQIAEVSIKTTATLGAIGTVVAGGVGLVDTWDRFERRRLDTAIGQITSGSRRTQGIGLLTLFRVAESSNRTVAQEAFELLCSFVRDYDPDRDGESEKDIADRALRRIIRNLRPAPGKSVGLWTKFPLDLEGARLTASGSDWSGCCLGKASFRGAVFPKDGVTEIKFVDADTRQAVFDDADITPTLVLSSRGDPFGKAKVRQGRKYV